MVQLRPDTTAHAAIRALSRASDTAPEVLREAAGPGGALKRYRAWAVGHIRAFRAHFTPRSIEQLLITDRHKLLLSLDASTYGDVGELIQLELDERVDDIEVAIRQLEAEIQRWSVWGSGEEGSLKHAGVVLDTNVVLEHASVIAEIDWHGLAGARAASTVILGIPLRVVEELDVLKRSPGEMVIGGRRISRRTLARKALIWLESTFSQPNDLRTLREGGLVDGQPTGDLYAVLMGDDVRVDRPAQADLDILDQAVALQPFTSQVAVATNDRAMRFRARSMGLHAFAPVDEDDTKEAGA